MKFRTGQEVTDGTRRGVITDYWIRKSGPNQGKLEVQWIGHQYGVNYEYPENLDVVK